MTEIFANNLRELTRINRDALANDALIIRSIGQRATVFGKCEAAGMVCKRVHRQDGSMAGLVYALHDCGLYLDAPTAVRVLNAYGKTMGHA